MKKDKRLFLCLTFLALGVVLVLSGADRYQAVLDKPTLPPPAKPRLDPFALPTPEEEAAEARSQEKIYLRLRETDLVRDVTVDGLTRLATGQLQRTYGLGEKPADFCAT